MENQQLKMEQEGRAEQAALPFVLGVNFTDCLRVNGIATELSVDDKRIQAHRVYAAWQRFLVGIGEVTGESVATTTKKGRTKEKAVVKEPMSLTREAEDLQEKMFTWITTKCMIFRLWQGGST